jgi:FkbM family methyltransferase
MIKSYLKFLYFLLFRRPKTFSQTGEDRIVEFYLGKQPKGFYVDIGANDPVYLNNTYLFYKKGWRGICLEPNASKCRLIRLMRPRDTVLNMGVGEKAGQMEFYIFDPDTVSTFSASETKKFQALGYRLKAQVAVPVKPLSEIFTQYTGGQSIDLLSVDTEGFDFQVLKSNDWNKFRPKMVIVEVVEHHGTSGTRINSQFDDFMDTVQYIKLADTNINAIYVEKSFAAVKHLESIS